jgi:hypothetical protein
MRLLLNTGAAVPTSKESSRCPRAGFTRRLCVQATVLHQASPVRRLMISKPLPFACTAGVSARRGHLLRGRAVPVLPVYLRLLHGFLDAAVSQRLSKRCRRIQPTKFNCLGTRVSFTCYGPMNERVYLSIICASILLLVTAFALGTPGLKSDGPSERAHLLRLPTPESGNLKGR